MFYIVNPHTAFIADQWAERPRICSRVSMWHVGISIRMTVGRSVCWSIAFLAVMCGFRILLLLNSLISLFDYSSSPSPYVQGSRVSRLVAISSMRFKFNPLPSYATIVLLQWHTYIQVNFTILWKWKFQIQIWFIWQEKDGKIACWPSINKSNIHPFKTYASNHKTISNYQYNDSFFS